MAGEDPSTLLPVKYDQTNAPVIAFKQYTCASSLPKNTNPPATAGDMRTSLPAVYDQIFTPVVAFKQYSLQSSLPTYILPFATTGVEYSTYHPVVKFHMGPEPCVGVVEAVPA